MKFQKISRKEMPKTLVVVLDENEEAFETLQAFAQKEWISAASLTAIGAFSRATVGWFDLKTKSYKKIEILEQCEVLSVIGDIAIGDDGNASLHMHTVLGLSDGSTRGGHLLKGFLRPTLEVVLVETPSELRRHRRPDLGIALIDANPQNKS